MKLLHQMLLDGTKHLQCRCVCDSEAPCSVRMYVAQCDCMLRHMSTSLRMHIHVGLFNNPADCSAVAVLSTAVAASHYSMHLLLSPQHDDTACFLAF